MFCGMAHEQQPSPPLTMNGKEFAALAGISYKTWRNYLRAGTFLGLEAGLPRRWSRRKVIAFLEEGAWRPRRRLA